MLARTVASLVVAAVAIVLAVVAWPQLLGLQETFGVAQLVALRGTGAVVALAAALLCTLLALISRRVRRTAAALGVVLVAFAAVNAAVIGTRGASGPGFETRAAADVTVLSWNTLGGAPGAATVAQLALDEHADVVALPETPAAFADEVAQRMTAGGTTARSLTVAFDQVSKSRSTSLVVADRLGRYVVEEGAGNTKQLPSVIAVPADGSGPTIVAVHSVAPVPHFMALWRADLAFLATLCGRDDVILAGDFNATLDHLAHLRGSGEVGACSDAAIAAGNGGVGSWPTALPPLLGAAIDHVLVSPGWRVVGMRVIASHDGDGSDHRPILAQLRPAS